MIIVGRELAALEACHMFQTGVVLDKNDLKDSLWTSQKTTKTFDLTRIWTTGSPLSSPASFKHIRINWKNLGNYRDNFYWKQTCNWFLPSSFKVQSLKASWSLREAVFAALDTQLFFQKKMFITESFVLRIIEKMFHTKEGRWQKGKLIC